MSEYLLNPITTLKGVGPSLQERLARLGIRSLQDLLLHLPSHYQDRTHLTPIADLRPGQAALIEGEVTHCEQAMGRRRSLLCRVRDGSGSISLRFYHFSAQQQRNLTPSSRIRAFGEPRRGSVGLELYHPEYQLLGEESAPLPDTLTPIYPTTEGLGQNSLRRLVDTLLATLSEGMLPDYLPPQAGWPSLLAALRFLHHPPPGVSLESLQAHQHPAQQRLVVEELAAHHLSLLSLRRRIKTEPAPPLRHQAGQDQALLEGLGFALTAAQERVMGEIRRDLAQGHPMLRLVQGDVGSGKTAVAALAALTAIQNGYQVALMAPTELLAEQHFQNFERWFTPLGCQLVWLSGRRRGKVRERALQALREGQAAIAIGTHALFQEAIEFDRLGLVIIDEQHRFGVQQRLALRDKNSTLRPHQLIMTATPIPRTLAMTHYADLDCSVIDQLPPGRTPVNTVVMSQERRQEVIERIRQSCQQGRQVYWVCPLIEESEQLEAQAAETVWQELLEALPEIQVGLVHGRLKAADKAAQMAAFKQGETQLLVATTVIEVGVDVPNASLMIIENPERLGLAQLHQLRGRVGRGATQSHCVLLYKAPLGDNARARLQALRESNDGFQIAEQDLRLRGPGELLGTRQTGEVGLRLADLVRDGGLVAPARAIAERLLHKHPQQAQALMERWLGEAHRYAQA